MCCVCGVFFCGSTVYRILGDLCVVTVVRCCASVSGTV